MTDALKTLMTFREALDDNLRDEVMPRLKEADKQQCLMMVDACLTMQSTLTGMMERLLERTQFLSE